MTAEDESGALAAPTEGEAEASHGRPVAEFGYQLVASYLFDCTVTRFDEDYPERPTFETGLETQDRDELPGFLALLTVQAEFRIRVGAKCRIETKTAGVFRRVGELDPASDSQFRQLDCAVILWPYARATVGEIARMTGLDLPPLPTVDVRRTLNARPLDQA
jgi:preprotein translocase subunit SecB